MAKQQIAETLLKFRTAGAKEATADTGRVQAQMDALFESTKQASRAATDLGQAIKEVEAVSSASVERARADMGRLSTSIRKGIEQTKTVLADVSKVGTGGPAARGEAVPGGIDSAFNKIALALPPDVSRNFQLLGNSLEIVSGVLPKVISAFASLNPAVLVTTAALGGAIAAVAIVNERYRDQTAGLRELVARERQFYELRVTGTTDMVRAEIKRAEIETRIARARVDELSVVEQGYREAAQVLGVFTGAAVEIGALAGIQQFGDIKALREEYEKAKLELANAQRQLGLYNSLLQDSSVAANDAAEAERKLAEERLKTSTKIFDNILNAELDVARLVEDGSTEAFDKRKSALELERRVLENNLRAAKDLAAEGNDEPLKRLLARISEIYTELSFLNDTTRQQIAAIEEQRRAEEEQLAVRREMIDAAKRYNADVARADETYARDRAAAARRLNDNLIRAAEEAANAAKAALDKLKEQREQLAADFANDEASAYERAQRERQQTLIRFAREEEQQAVALARRLRDIRERFDRDEEDAAETRNFARLFDLARQRERELNDAQRSFNEQRADRQAYLRQQLQDQAEAYQQERAARLVKYQQDLADARARYDREVSLANERRATALATARRQYQDELREAARKYYEELSMRRQAIQSELRLIQQGAEAKLRLEADYWKQALALVASATAASSGGGSQLPTLRQYGGYLNSPALVNEARRESFTASGMTAPFPPGLGLFIPARPGTVDARGGAPVFNQTIQITAGAGIAQVGAIVPVIRQETRRLLKEYFD